MNRTISTTLHNILSLLSVAEDYGFADYVFFDAMFEMLDYNLAAEEIEDYAKWFLTKEALRKGYSQSDYDNAKERLTALATKYNK